MPDLAMSETSREKLPEWIYRALIFGLLGVTLYFTNRLVVTQDKMSDRLETLADTMTMAIHDLDSRVRLLEYENGKR